MTGLGLFGNEGPESSPNRLPTPLIVVREEDRTMGFRQ
jgi:hypothetical protein